MKLDEEAAALHAQVDDLARRSASASLEDWCRVETRLRKVMLHGQSEIAALQREMVVKVRDSLPNWSWFEVRAAIAERRETIDSLHLLRMCVQSRIFELEAAARQQHVTAE